MGDSTPLSHAHARGRAATRVSAAGPLQCHAVRRENRLPLAVSAERSAAVDRGVSAIAALAGAGVFESLVHDLRECIRHSLHGLDPQPTAAIYDARTLQSTPESGARAGYDGAK